MATLLIARLIFALGFIVLLVTPGALGLSGESTLYLMVAYVLICELGVARLIKARLPVPLTRSQRNRALLPWFIPILLAALALFWSAISGQEKPRTDASSTSSPGTPIATPAGPELTEQNLREMADAQNKSLPLRKTENLELVRIDAGPGLLLTYQIRVLDETVARDTFSEEQVAEIEREAIKESCAGFKQALAAGVSYVIAYSAADGSSIFTFPVNQSDCE